MRRATFVRARLFARSERARGRVHDGDAPVFSTREKSVIRLGKKLVCTRRDAVPFVLTSLALTKSGLSPRARLRRSAYNIASSADRGGHTHNQVMRRRSARSRTPSGSGARARSARCSSGTKASCEYPRSFLTLLTLRSTGGPGTARASLRSRGGPACGFAFVSRSLAD